MLQDQPQKVKQYTCTNRTGRHINSEVMESSSLVEDKFQNKRKRPSVFLLHATFAFYVLCRKVLIVAAFCSFPLQKFYLNHVDTQKYGRRLIVTFYGDNMSGGGKRQAQIRRKIVQLKKEGRLKKPQSNEDEKVDSINDVYAEKIRQKLGKGKSKLLGFSGGEASEDDDNEMNDEVLDGSLPPFGEKVLGRIGALPSEELSPVEDGGYQSPKSDVADKATIIDPTLFDNENDGDMEDELSEDDLVDMVAKKLMEKRSTEQREKESRTAAAASKEVGSDPSVSCSNASPPQQITSGVGGSWRKDQTENVELYQPKTGSWGAFPRPRDISKAYGGGRRVGPGYSNEESRLKSAEATRQRLREYREKAGIEVQSEKDHAAEIEEAIRIGSLAMQRGMYSTSVSALEKVTKYCSTNSKVGGKVFLELAMAYEAVGRTDEAITVYATLSKSRIEEIKFDAKRLLYGIEAMQFMRNEMKDSSFSRKKVRNTFIDTTGLNHIAQNFDDVYQTAYIDLESNFYKRLTESVVRSPREARQIILRATNSGEVERTRIIQALRSLSRNFDDALEKEMERSKVNEPVAVMDGKPIVSSRKQEEFGSALSNSNFILADSVQMFENLNGKWRLQLLADKRGDGVKFFNNTLSLQRFNMEQGRFEAQTPVGFGNMHVSGKVEFNEDMRVIQRRKVEKKGGGMLGALMNPLTGVLGAIQIPQQIMTVDSTLLITRAAPGHTLKTNDKGDKDYFSVWRRID